MNYDNNRQNAHNEIDHIFKDLLPTRNMAERPAQVALCHQMFNEMVEKITVDTDHVLRFCLRGGFDVAEPLWRETR